MQKKVTSLVLMLALMLSMMPLTAFSAEAPEVTATSAILIDNETGEVLWERNADAKREIASMTKIMVAYLTYEALDEGRITFGTKVPISDEVRAFSNNTVYSNLPFDEEKDYTVEEVLDAFMCYSSCAAGPALGELLYGTEEDCVAAMNEKAKEMGLDATFTLTYDDGIMSARTTAKMVRAIVQDYPQILACTSQVTFEFGGKTYNTTNKLLTGEWGDIGVVDGMKTGTSPNAGFCFAATSSKDSARLVSVVMNAASRGDRFNDSAELLSYGYTLLGEKRAAGYAYAYPHTASVTMDGQALALQAYLVNGNNYVRLSDFANILNGTAAQFALEYDQASNSVVVETGKAYRPGGSEGLAVGTEPVFTKLLNPTLRVDGAPYAINAYLIDDFNYMKVRDLAATVGCGIDYNNATGEVVLLPNQTSTAVA